MRQVVDRVHPAWQQLDLQVCRRLCLAHRQRQIAGSKSRTWQALTLAGLLQRRWRGVIAHLTGNQISGAGATPAIAATIGQAYILANGCIQDGLVFFGLELMAAGVDRDGKSHGSLLHRVRNSAILLDFTG